MAQSTETTKRAIPRGWKILLGVSLAINLAVIGLVAGATLRKGPERSSRGGGHANYAMPYIQALPRAERRAIFEASHPKHNGASRAERRALYQQVMDILRADEFDRSAVEAVLVMQTKVTLSGQSGAQAKWLNRIEKMDVQERRVYADAVEEVLKRGPKRKRKSKSD